LGQKEAGSLKKSISEYSKTSLALFDVPNISDMAMIGKIGMEAITPSMASIRSARKNIYPIISPLLCHISFRNLVNSFFFFLFQPSMI